MALSVKEASNIIERYIRETRTFAGISFDKYDDRSYVSYVSDELVGDYKRAFGGDYESSITIAYSTLGVGFTIEVYFSSAKGRLLSSKLPSIIKDGFDYYGLNSFVKCDFTRYIPGESALTFTLSTHPNDVNELTNHIGQLGEFVQELASLL